MPLMWDKNGSKVIAILCSDFHLSLNPPIFRSVEKDWFEAMRRPLDEIKRLQKKHNCLVLCAGDIFDKWNSPPELINFALEHLPNGMISIPGQHDLPLHRYEDIEKSAYWTLEKACKIIDINRNKDLIGTDKLALYGFPYGCKIEPRTKTKDDVIRIAIAHEYCCIEGHNYPQAPDESYLRMNKERLVGYNVIMFGDNHKGFMHPINQNSTVFNCGSLMRRKSDEVDYKPQVGILFDSGRVKPYHLDTSEDKYLEVQEGIDEKTSLDMKTFVEELEKLGETDLDFQEVMKEYLEKNRINDAVCKIILRAME